MPTWAICLLVFSATLALGGAAVLLTGGPDRQLAHSLALRQARQLTVKHGRIIRSYKDGNDWIVVVRGPFRDPVYDFWDYPIRVNTASRSAEYDLSIGVGGPGPR